MSFISKTARDRVILDNFWGRRGTPLGPLTIMTSLNFGYHLGFWWKWKMLFILKAVKNRAILGKL